MIKNWHYIGVVFNWRVSVLRFHVTINFSFHVVKPVQSRRSLVCYARRNEIGRCTTMSSLLVTACLVMVLFMNMMTRTYTVFHLLRVFTAIFMSAINAAGAIRFLIRREIIYLRNYFCCKTSSSTDSMLVKNLFN